MLYKYADGKTLSVITNNTSYVETISSYWTEFLGTPYNKANILLASDLFIFMHSLQVIYKNRFW